MHVAVVGLGYWGPNLVRNLMALDHCEQLTVCDLDEVRVKRVLSQYSSVRGTTRFEDVLEDTGIDAVVLATPVHSHFSLALSCLRSEKSVLVEKPLTTSTAEALQLIDMATRNGVLVMAGHTFLYSPPVMAVKELVRCGELGTPLYLQSSRVNLGIHQSTTSVLWDLAPHDLSILIDWLNEAPSVVSATGRASLSANPPDVAFVDVAFPSGFIANFHLSWLAPTKMRRMTLVGSKKMLVYEDTHVEEPLKIYDKGLDLADPSDFGEYRLTYRTGDVISPRVETWEPLRLELESFLERVSRGDRPSEREMDAVAVVRIIEAAEQSLGCGGTPVSL